MGRPPAYIFIVRHGNRLDAADNLWHITSPTPYDPPLTYGGWTQARAIGQRIADILRENAAPLETPSSTSRAESPAAHESPAPHKQTGPPKIRRYKVVIHSSPFLRCLQTSIAVGAGIASDGQPLESPHPIDPIPALQLRTPNQKVPGTQMKDDKDSSKDTKEDKTHSGIYKSVLRVDGFLGEWLSPDYFELISPPPSSVTMVTGAKAELLRREDYSSFIHPSHHQVQHAHAHSTGHLWNASRSNTWSSQQLAGQDELPKSGSQPISPPGLFGGSSAAVASSIKDGGDLPFGSSQETTGRRRAVSGAGGGAPGGGSAAAAAARGGYVAPFPHFALSHQAPAPTGYVAHARDFCVDVDYQWDSMRAPYDWGDGGEFGEEWTSMHRRFRKGLQKLVDWYATRAAPYEMVTQTVHFKTDPSPAAAATVSATSDASECAIDDDEVEDDDDDAYVNETVVVLVSHGAGCNALIGAITQEPVLMDVGLASLSVAVRKHGKSKVPTAAEAERERAREQERHRDRSGSRPGRTNNTPMSPRPRPLDGQGAHGSHPGGIVPLHRYYEMKLFANSDHLRSSTPTSPSVVSSPGAGAGFGGGSGRGGSMAMVMGSGATRSRHANSLSGVLGNLAYLDNGGSLAGVFGGGDASPVRRSVSTASRSYLSTPGGGGGNSSPTSARSNHHHHPAGGGITIGSGVTSFLPSPAAAASTRTPDTTGSGSSSSGHRSGSGSGIRPRTGSFGLWSPVIRPRDALSDDGRSGRFGLGLGLRSSGNSSRNSLVVDDDDVDGEGGDNDDIEILLSFAPEKTSSAGPKAAPTEKAEKKVALTPGPVAGGLATTTAPPRRLVGLTISTSSAADAAAPPTSAATNAAKTIHATAPSPTPSTSSSNNGLWNAPLSETGATGPRL